MQLTLVQTHISPVVEEFEKKMETINLLYYASQAASEMEFDSMEELNDSLKCAMDICLAAGIPIKGNFLRVYRSFDNELTYDWKLSMLAYRLVCFNGRASNPHVARLIVQLIKNDHLNHFR